MHDRVTTSAAAPAPEIWPVITVQSALCGPLVHESRMDRASFRHDQHRPNTVIFCKARGSPFPFFPKRRK